MGLPYELARGALAGVVDIAKSVDLSPGELTVTFAAYDPIESSIMSFKIAGGLLLWAFMQEPNQLTQDHLKIFWDRWSSNNFAWK